MRTLADATSSHTSLHTSSHTSSDTSSHTSAYTSSDISDQRIELNNQIDEDELDYGRDEKLQSYKLQEQIKTWANKHNITHVALKDLINILKENFDIIFPQDPRTLLKTPKTVHLNKIDNGYYWHNGIKACLQNAFNNLASNILISININIDGLPVFNSSKFEFWPILFNIHNMPNVRPMIIGIFCGEGKPKSVTNYLAPFVNEINDVIKNGIEINGFTIKLQIRTFICDSPARAFIKGAKKPYLIIIY